MKTKIKKSIVLAGLLGIISMHASASVYNFVNLIDTNNGSITGTLGNGNAFSGNPGEAGFQTFDWTVDGLTLTATGSTVTGGAFAYLDSGNAGLGVCKALTGNNQCTPSSDDNVTINEILDLHFNKLAEIDFNQVVFRDANHNIINPNIEISINGGGFSALNLASVQQGTDFAFRTLNQANQFYISVLSADEVTVSTPGTLVLLALGLVGLGATRRKHNLV
ncbi:hypothetical protein [Nitrosomonas sp.]|uniref:hypothetical protein n=1 Tax=Nitrosomonas sp. TaxID=42353 RepID=UPI00208CC232|nr:hypothetical protein [Nitrosomonas sp.]GJL76933.1 MAG: hypothetical protein NMNS02_30390 [Nitrosomonas sp.]